MTAKPNPFFSVKVTDIEHYTDRLFRFRVERPANFRFRSGEFVMIGLVNSEGKRILRAYSIASPAWDETLEFYSIKVADGPLTSILQTIQIGDEIIMGRKPTGTLVLDALTPARRLYLLSTGTGFAPFASILREPETYEKFEHVIVTHTCRDLAELRYSQETVAALAHDPLVGDIAPEVVRLYATTTRETSDRMGRITYLIETGRLFTDIDCQPFDANVDRAMICGSMQMIQDTKTLLEAASLSEGSNAKPADFVIEKAFAG